MFAVSGFCLASVNMKLLRQTLLIVAALLVVTLGPEKLFASSVDKPRVTVPTNLPPDDPRDVKTLLQYWGPKRVTTDGDGNVTEIAADQGNLVNNPELRLALSRLRHVRSLACYGSKRDSGILATIAAWPSLKNISLDDTFGDDDLRNLEPLQSLLCVNIYSDQITDSAFGRLAKLKNLIAVTIGSAKIDGSGLNALSGLKKLGTLCLRNCRLDDEGMKNLKGMQLQTLDLQSPAITDRGIDAIKGMTTLRTLYISDAALTDRAFGPIANIKGLSSLLIINSPKIDGSGLKELSALKQLETLNLSRCHINDEGVKNLKGLRLKRLNLGFTEITDRAIDEIKDMTSLETVYLAGTRTTKAAIFEKLKGIKGLKIGRVPIEELQ